MATGITLIKQAIYGVVPNLLAKGNMTETIHRDLDDLYFPTYCNGVPQNQFLMKKIHYPYGYDPAGYLRFEGRESGSTVLQCRDMQIPSNGQGKAITIYADIRGAAPAHDYDIPVHIRNPAYYTDGHKQMAVGFHNFPMGMYSNRQAMDMVCSPNKNTRYEFDMSYGGYPQRMQRTLIIHSDGALAHKFNQEPHKYVTPGFTYPDAYFTDMDIGAKESWGFLCGRINCILIWPRALTSSELDWLHSAGRSHFDGIIANHIGNHAVDIVSGTASTSYPAPKPYTETTFPPEAKTGKALLDDALYGLLPQLLAKGNAKEPLRSGYFPTLYRSDVRRTPFYLLGQNFDPMPEGYGYRPDAGGSSIKGFLAFDGVECRIWNWRAYVPAGHCTIWADIEGEICNEAWDGSGPYGIPLRFGEEGSEIKNPTTDLITEHTGTEIRQQLYDTDEVDSYSMQFPQRYTLALGISGSGDREVFRQINNGTASTISSTFNNNFGLYRIFDIGARRSWGYFKGRIRTLLIFSRLLYDEELAWLHENSLAGFSGLWANDIGNGEAETYDSTTTTTAAPTTTTPEPTTTPPPPTPPPSYSLYRWKTPKLWDTRRRVNSGDVNNHQSNLKYLKQSRCQTFSLAGKTGTQEVIPAGGRRIIGLMIKRIPPGGKLYLQEASRVFSDGILVLQLEAGVHPTSPSSNAEFFECPELGEGSFNRTEEDDPEINDYRRTTRWSSPVNSSDPESFGGWFYDEYGHLLMVNHSTTYILLTLSAVARNLTDDKEHTSSEDDFMNFTFYLTGE